jgi:sugar phosphate isomerase/epimerase
MKLAFSTNAYTRFSLTDALEGIKSAGFEGVEILADKPHAYPEDINPALINDVNRTLERLELKVSNVNCNCSFGYWKDAPGEPYFEPSLISPIAKHREDRSRMILKTLDFAQKIGARNISITSGRCLGGMPPDSATKQFRESILPILDRADALGVDVGIELEPGLFLEWAYELREWIHQLKHPRFGANLDVGHSHVLGENITEVIDELAGSIWNLHVEDLPGRKHYHMIPGEGDYDWKPLHRALVDIEYDRFATVELYTHTQDPQTAANKSFAFLNQHFA